MRPRFVQSCQDAKIFGVLAKFLGFHKKFWFAKVRHYSAEIGFSGYQIDQWICEFGGIYKIDKYRKEGGKFVRKYIDFFRYLPQPMRDICPRLAQIFGAVWQCRVWNGEESQPHTA